MVNKFLIAIVGIVAAMAALVLVPSFNSSPEQQQDLSIEYRRQNLTGIEDGQLIATSAEDFVIRIDRSAVYRNLTGAPDVKQFMVSSEEMSRLKGLILSTGFMQVPGADYPQKEGLGNLTKYTLKLASGSNSKTITWVNIEASETSVPSIVTNIGAQLDTIIERRA
jgi:type II secretory pathway pseudopilin PulG